MFAQQAVRLDDEDKYQHGKNHSIGKLGGNISLGKDFYDTQKELNVTGIFGRRMYETWTEVMNILKTGRIDLNSYVGKRMKLEEFEKAIELFPQVSGRIVFRDQDGEDEDRK